MSKPVGPYSPVVRAGDWIIVSGQMGLKDGALADGVAAQTTQAIANVSEHLQSVGAALSDVAKTLCFLVDMNDFATFNEAYIGGFGDHRPARSTIGVAALPIGASVEVEAWAYKRVTGVVRCGWATGDDALMTAHHDDEWGATARRAHAVRVHRVEGAQAGLSAHRAQQA